MFIRTLALVAVMLASLAGGAIAQQTPPPGAKDPPAAAQQNMTAPGAPAVPHANQLMILIRSTLLAANHANLTGNYTVLRELGTPDFQQTNSPARLADIFRDLRSKNIDLGPVAVLDAKLVRQPAIDANGRLRLSGFFPSRPEQVNFDLLFQMMGGRWRLYGIALNTTRNETPVAETGAAQPTAPPAAAGKLQAAKKPTAAAANPGSSGTSAPKTKASEKKASSASTSPPSGGGTPPDIRD